jgi:hypothetical protein
MPSRYAARLRWFITALERETRDAILSAGSSRPDEVGTAVICTEGVMGNEPRLGTGETTAVLMEELDFERPFGYCNPSLGRTRPFRTWLERRLQPVPKQMPPLERERQDSKPAGRQYSRPSAAERATRVWRRASWLEPGRIENLLHADLRLPSLIQFESGD